ncbi:hypothetical protein ARMA_0265 [Ardenticatena maritima]|uniref:DUF2089 domain-containing protein n=1 Tax=Ardenticatena maritima TaxID=872965 RepID=A0A0M8K6P6_9CHLR|nr:DUF2089 domain-containing protein [Ardenticatena maritima]KPL87946.1 hypothetical protein SE16_10500 [Ardenticatena maritima]GAP61842.1 hypothetical protein ARMA_0265 [Ardenticatena maritima]
MQSVPTRCPFCGTDLVVTELHCFGCETSFQGHFSLERLASFAPEQLPVLQRLARLSPEQLRFVEAFLRAEGKFRRLEEELNLSYPTLRARLNEVLVALGFEPSSGAQPEPPTPAVDREAVLAQLEAGEISFEEAMQLLKGR